MNMYAEYEPDDVLIAKNHITHIKDMARSRQHDVIGKTEPHKYERRYNGRNSHNSSNHYFFF
jgi:hypothetical protein